MGNHLTPQNISTSDFDEDSFQPSRNHNPQQNLFMYEDLVFDSRIESGNLMYVDKVSSSQYNIWIAPDCYKTIFENKNRVWFYFKVTNIDLHGSLSRVITFKIMNMSKLEYNNYKEGMVPVYKSPSNQNVWKYIPSPITELATVENNTIQITFEYTFDVLESRQGVYFAFTFPYLYSDCQNYVKSLEQTYKDHHSILISRNLIGYTFENRRIDVLVIAHKAKTTDSESANYTQGSSVCSEACVQGIQNPKTIDKIFDDLSTRQILDRQDKQYILISARVHAAENPGSFMLEGFIKSLLDEGDKTSTVLLRKYIFVVVPMLNPDGVFRGHYRTDTRGRDLNRTYYKAICNPKEFPEPSALIEVAKYLSMNKKLVVYIDFHSHSNKNSGFILGSYHPEPCIMAEMRIFARVMDIYSQNFDYNCCRFGVEKDLQDKTKEGMSSQVIREITGIIYSYTIETGYHRTTKDRHRYSHKHNKFRDLKKKVTRTMTTLDFEEIGNNLRNAIMEVVEGNHPQSRLIETWYTDIQTLRGQMNPASNSLILYSSEKDQGLSNSNFS